MGREPAQAGARQGEAYGPGEPSARAGILRPVSPHRLRHSYATHLLRHGAPLVAIQALLSHASLVSTEVHLALEKDLARMVRTSHPREQDATIARP